MAVDLFSLRMNLETTGTAQAMSALKGVEQAGAKTAASIGGIAANTSRMGLAAESAAAGVASRFGVLGGVMSALGPVALGAGVALGGIGLIMKATAPAMDNFRLSTLRLDGAARIAGISIAFLQGVSQKAQDAFKLSSAQANDLTASSAKLAAKTGDLNQTGSFLGAWLNVAASQGLNASQALDALNITLRGQDEGLDRMFQKNPSVIWKEYADSVGKTVGQLTQAEKWQSIINATMDASLKVGDAYTRFLDTTVGKQSQLAVASERLQIAIGKLFEPLRGWIAGVGTDFLNWLTRVVEKMGTVIDRIVHGWVPGLGLVANATRLVMGAGARADFTDVEGSTSATSPSGTPAPAPPPPTPLTEAERKRLRAEYVKRVLGLANMDEAMKATDQLDFQGVSASHLALRGGGVGTLTPGIGARHQSAGDEFMGGSLGGDLEGIFAQGGGAGSAAGRLSILAAFGNEARRQAVQLKVQFAQVGTQLGMSLANGFASALAAGIQGKNVFKALGSSIMQGLGGIMTQLGQALISYGVIMIKLLPFLTNIFTSGPAALAAGIALTALGAAFGSAFTGHGGGSGGGSGGGDFRDRTTQITLTANGAGGLRAPHHQVGPTIHVLGKDSPEGQRLFGEHYKSAQRSRNV